MKEIGVALIVGCILTFIYVFGFAMGLRQSSPAFNTAVDALKDCRNEARHSAKGGS